MLQPWALDILRPMKFTGAFVLAAVSTLAQNNGAIQGVVKDSSEAVIALARK